MFFLTVISVQARVYCENADGSQNGRGWNGSTCADAARPVYYRVTNLDTGDAPLSDAAMRTEFQTVYNDSWLGDTIRLTAGQGFVFTNGDAYGIQISKRKNGTGYLTITSTEADKLPPEGTRVTPVYRPLMPVLYLKHNSPVFAVRGAGPNPAEHIRFRGLIFEPHPSLAVSARMNYGAVRAGGAAWNKYTSDFTNYADPTMYNTTTRTQALSGQATVQMTDASDLQAGLKIFFNSGIVAPYYTIQSVNTDTPGAHYITLTSNLASTINANSKVWVSMDRPEWQPDDIVVQHCLFLNPMHRYQFEQLLQLATRQIVIRDNFFSAPLSSSGYGGADTKCIGDHNGVGPYIVENNYIDGGSENVMFGGNYASMPNETFVSGLFRYNFFSHIPERDYLWYWCVTQEGGCVHAGGTVTWGNVTAKAGISVPGLTPRSPRLIFPGRHIISSTGGTRVFVARNAGVVGTTEPNWDLAPSVGNYISSYDPARAGMGTTMCNGVEEPGDGVCFQRTVGGPLIKNNFELKRGRNVTLQHNVFDWFGSLHGFNLNQYMMVNIKAEGNSSSNYCGAGLPPPACYRAETRGVYILNNILRDFSGGIALTGSYGGPTNGGPPPSRNGDYVVRGNLFIQTERPNFERFEAYKMIEVQENGSDTGTARTIPIDDIVIEKNTFYSTVVGYNRAGRKLNPINFGGAANAGFGGTRVLSGNILNKWTFPVFSRKSSNFLSDLSDFGVVQSDHFPKTREGGVWGPHILLGGSSTGAPAGTVWTGCPTSAECIRTESDVPDWSQVFVNPDARDFRLRDDHWGKRAMPDGSDVGADMSQVPEIRALTVTPSDRSVLFQWHVTDAIASVPCVVEVHTAPDLESGVWQGQPAGYAAELSDIAAYHGGEADTSGHSLRNGTERTLAVG